MKLKRIRSPEPPFMGIPEIFEGGVFGGIRLAIIIGNGFAGAENQCIGLVRALGLSGRHNLYQNSLLMERILWLGGGGLSQVLEADAKQIARMAQKMFEKDGPLLVVASDRDTISVASSIKRLAPENVFVIQRWITPHEPPDRHVVLTIGALHQADSAALRHVASAWHDELAGLPKPLLVVNVGGPTSHCPYGVNLAKQLIAMLQGVLSSCGSIRISFSRRTPEKVAKIIMKDLCRNPKVYIWDGEDPNPHMGHLAWADAFVITADSVSMLSEACSTGKLVYVVGAERCTWKFADFQKSLLERGFTRPFTGEEDISKNWCHTPLNDLAEAASRVNTALAERGWRIHP